MFQPARVRFSIASKIVKTITRRSKTSFLLFRFRSCETRCQATHLDCVNSCPCGINCPDGCNGDDDFCSANEFCSYTDILVLNHKQTFQDKALVINKFNDQSEVRFFQYNFVGTSRFPERLPFLSRFFRS